MAFNLVGIQVEGGLPLKLRRILVILHIFEGVLEVIRVGLFYIVYFVYL